MGQACEVRVAGLLGLVRADLESAGVRIAPDFRMPIGEVEGIAVAVAISGYGGEIKPNAAVRVSDEEAVINAAIVLLQHDPHLRWERDVGVLGVEFNVACRSGGNRAEARIARAHEAVHGITPQRWGQLPVDGDAFIGGAMIEGDALVVLKQFALADQVSVAGLVSLGHVTPHPYLGVDTNARPADRVGFCQETAIIILVHDPSEAQLAEVGKTSGALSLNPGFIQDGEEQGGENRNRSYYCQ